MTISLFRPGPWKDVRALLARGGKIDLVLDLDGTIAPIASRPDRVRVPGAMLRKLERAAVRRGVRLTILSARNRADLRRLLPVPGLELVGQYGLEGPVGARGSARARYHRVSRELAEVFRPLVLATPGALLEPKGMTVAVHDRNVRAPRALRALHRGLRRIASGEARRRGFVGMPGRRVLDFVPRGWDKGRTIDRLRRRGGRGIVFYFGDSDADEPAFGALGREDVSVRVGRRPTRARYRVADRRGVARFLDAVADVRPARRDRRRYR